MPVEHPRSFLNFGDIINRDEGHSSWENENKPEGNGSEEEERKGGKFWNLDNFVFDPDELVCFGVIHSVQNGWSLNLTLKGGIEKLVFSFEDRKDALRWRDRLEKKVDERYGETSPIKIIRKPAGARVQALEIEDA